MKKLFVLCSILLVVTSSCKKHTTAPTSPQLSSLIFGSYNPMCQGPGLCGKFYLLQNNVLSPDQSFYRTPNPFMLIKLPDSLYQIAKPLISNFSTYLYAHRSDSAIGCPGCADGNVVLLWATDTSGTTKWLINSDTTQLPVELRPYIAQVEAVLSKLN